MYISTTTGSTLSLPAPPAYEDAAQYRLVEGESYDLLTQQPAAINVSHPYYEYVYIYL